MVVVCHRSLSVLPLVRESVTIKHNVTVTASLLDLGLDIDWAFLIPDMLCHSGLTFMVGFLLKCKPLPSQIPGNPNAALYLP